MSEYRAVIRRARHRLRSARVFCRATDGSAAVAIVIFVIVAIDTTSPLAPSVRLAAGIALLLGALSTIVWCAMAARISLMAAAQRLELAADTTRNTLVNAMQLARSAHPPGVATACAHAAFIHADALALQSAAARVVDRRALFRALARGAGSVLVLAVMVLVMPRVAHSAWLRFTEPFAGHPPYSRTEFELSSTPTPLLATMDVAVRVRTSLVVPRTLELINRDTGEAIETTEVGPGVFVATLARMTEEITLYAQAPTGRSRTITITPIDKPMIERAAVRVFVQGEEFLSVDIPIVGRVEPIRAPVGSRVEFMAIASISLGGVRASPERAGVLVSVQGRVATAAITIESLPPFDLVLTPVSRSGVESDDAVRVRIEPYVAAIPGGQPQGEASQRAVSEPESGAHDEPGALERALERVSEQIQEMTDEQLDEAAEDLVAQIDEAIEEQPVSQRERGAQEALSRLHEALADQMRGVPGASDRARTASADPETKPPTDDDPNKGDPNDDRDRLVIDPSFALPKDTALPPPARLQGDTLVVETGTPAGPVRISLDGASRDLYASLNERERAIVAHYYRQLARRDAEQEASP